MSDSNTNFPSHEFACQGENCCGGSSPISPRLIEALEELRSKLGDNPLIINSGFRCLTHNRIIGSSDTSQHTRGFAADVALVSGLSAVAMAEVAKTIDAFSEGGIGLYNTFIHLDVRKGYARWDNRS